MTQNKNFKRRVRERATKTGESYTAALSHFRQPAPPTTALRLAVAQIAAGDDPRDAAELRRCGAQMRELMREAKAAGARLVHFPEGATCAPNKRKISATGPETVGPADWSRCRWAVLREELEAIRQLAGELGLWTVFGSVHQLSSPHRPHNSLYVISDRGELVTRYDERMLSHTKISYMYTPGALPVIFAVDGVRFGCTLGMEAHYPELFLAYEQLDVDCVLFSTTEGWTPNGLAFAAEAQGHAASNSFWVSFAVHAQPGSNAPSGIVGPDGQWAARCASAGAPGIAVAEIGKDMADPSRPWRRTARGGLYGPHRADDDPRSRSRTLF